MQLSTAVVSCKSLSRFHENKLILTVARCAFAGPDVEETDVAEASPGFDEGGNAKGLQFSDKDEHMYFWFPLLAGLSELTFDPRSDIRHSALEVRREYLEPARPLCPCRPPAISSTFTSALGMSSSAPQLALFRCAQVLFDTLKFHGASFTAPFWARVFDSVLLPIFDHVRAEVRARDAWGECSP
jgi:brefeldin A-inhibited guanine nucleotide-exchange protein